ncbi:TVP38/TMEM64 family protein [Vacuolonema iberomarrocanum]|uniref:TVP38/TMEM64 family protein n=1 Tax=Vacuolonema iberomarrocanum TaxID=3454632 RepID=UPI0019FA85C4|nr:TVP38/TMEM64 family protein [filamentous cyanobacterium LEGE 07170]
MLATFPIRKILLALLVVATTYVVMALALRAIGLENAHRLIAQAGPLAPLIFIPICAVSLILAPLSGSSIYIVGGALFGKGYAFLLSLIATLLGCNANFWISRRFGRKVAARFIGHNNLDDLDQTMMRIKSHHSVFYMTLIMPLSQDLVSYAAGLMKLRYRDFLFALLISAPIVVGAYIFVGTSILEALV